ncbi:MAG: hypothetical protein II563_09165 [Treponema sp.]|nr:hypothetical protein [Treponema sp.]
MNFSTKLKEYIEEERSDNDKYLELASLAPEKYAPIIRDIAKEERSHARHLEEILADCEMLATEDDSEPLHHNKVNEKKHSSDED